MKKKVLAIVLGSVAVCAMLYLAHECDQVNEALKDLEDED